MLQPIRNHFDPIYWGHSPAQASREFLYVEDAAEGILLAAETLEDPTPVNLGSGREIKIPHLVTRIASLTGYQGHIEWDTSQPDGQPCRCLDVTRAGQLLGWPAQVSLEEGLKRTVDWYQQARKPAKKAW